MGGITDFADDVLGLDPSGQGVIGSLGLTGLTDSIEDGFKSLTGQTAQDAARDAAIKQEEAGQRALTIQEDAQRRLEERLAPFEQFGLGALGRAETLFGPNAGAAIQSDPLLNQLQSQTQEQILARQAAQGRIGTGDTLQILQNALLGNQLGFLQSERDAALNRLGLGQSSAAQTGFSGIQSAGAAGNILGQIANAQAGGLIGGAQARQQGLGNLLSLGGQVVGGFMGAPPPGAGTGGIGGLF